MSYVKWKETGKSWTNLISDYSLHFEVCVDYVVYVYSGNNELIVHVLAKCFKTKKAPEVKQKAKFLPLAGKSP